MTSLVAIFTILAVSIATEHNSSQHKSTQVEYYNVTYSEYDARRTLYFAYAAYCQQAELGLYSTIYQMHS